MIGFKPPLPDGPEKQVRWARWATDAIMALRPINTPGLLTSSTTNGVSVRPTAKSGGAVAGATRYRVKSEQALYLTCRAWDGTTEGSTDIFIAKNFDARQPTSEVIDGTTKSYSYTAVNKRTATSGSITQKEIITPRYLVNSEIAAVTITGGTGVVDGSSNPVTLQETSCRTWAAARVQT